jgi:hypothetical protein
MASGLIEEERARDSCGSWELAIAVLRVQRVRDGDYARRKEIDGLGQRGFAGLRGRLVVGAISFEEVSRHR